MLSFFVLFAFVLLVSGFSVGAVALNYMHRETVAAEMTGATRPRGLAHMIPLRPEESELASQS